MYALPLAAALGFVALVHAADTTSPCSAQPSGYGPLPSPNDEATFKTFSTFASAANAAVAPPLYQRVFANLNASEFATASNVYLGYYELKSYDAASCTALCDQSSGCVGANLYFERDPSLLPDARLCPNPAALTVIKCALWGSPVTAQQATNDGQFQADFHVLVAGSNGYMKLPSQACSAISAAWGGSSSGYSWPTGAAGAPPNWQSFTTGFGPRLRGRAARLRGQVDTPPLVGEGGKGGQEVESADGGWVYRKRRRGMQLECWATLLLDNLT
ncbi:hypothetical protein LTR91_004368 [Friedmanniomyces endolithicus]|uniref:Apple domain-containing protein n=1 Tax=Friedmanniomyces endolithicus TaxID=329885 RepID=A0AAN6QXX7_9PEZI|nr:hypothetical protein LTR91_004368 [Friedmanniomyces endolithicus]